MKLETPASRSLSILSSNAGFVSLKFSTSVDAMVSGNLSLVGKSVMIERSAWPPNLSELW